MAKVLIVDDHASDRRYLGSLLTERGHAVVEAVNGADALEAVRNHRPDLVITDLVMPVMDGHVFASQLRQLEGLDHTPIVFCTANFQEDEARTLGSQCGVGDLLFKPVDPARLAAILDAILNHDNQNETAAAATVADAVRRVADLEVSEKRMAAVVQVSQQLAQEHDPGELLQQVCAAAREMALAERATVGIVAADGATVIAAITQGGNDTDQAERSSDPSSSVLRAVFEERRAVRLSNPGGRPEAIGFRAETGELLSYLAVPMVSSSRVHGWIGVRNKLGGSEFTTADELGLTTLGVQAGIALENARLVAGLRRQTSLLQRKENRTLFAMRAARMGTWELAMGEHTLAWSDSMSAVFGMPPNRFPTQLDDLWTLIHPADVERIRIKIGDALRTRQSLQVEFRTRWPDGSERWAAMQGSVVAAEHEDEPAKMLGIASDVTDRKHLEAQLAQAVKMEAIGQLAGGVAHDFNNLLTAIMGYTNFLMEELQGSPHVADLEQILTASRRAERLTNQLLAFSRKQVLQPRLVDVNDLVTGISKLLKRVIGEHIAVQTVLDATTPFVRADPSQLEQVIMNIAVNARDAMPTGGTLTIRTSVRTDGAGPDPNARWVRLSLGDTGSGMDLATQTRVFEPFFTTKDVGRGTGLGLATVYGIVRQSGGRISVESALGTGTTFDIDLPLAGGDTAPDVRGDGRTPAARGSETVLLVEDDDAVRMLVRTILERAGFHVLLASQSSEAVDLFGQHHVDMVVTDVIMPGGSGVELYKKLALDRPGLPVLYTSGYTDELIAEQAHLNPEAAFIRKPFTTVELLAKVREVLDRTSP